MSKRNIVQYVKSLVEAGVMERPLWLGALERVPPLKTPKPGRRPAKITFPEDELIATYYARHPEARLEPLEVTSFEPPVARKFARRQLQLMQEGMPKKDAYAQTEKEFKEAAGAAAGPRPSVVQRVQGEEDAALQGALQQYAQRHGPELLEQHASELRRAQRAGAPQRPQQQQQGGGGRGSGGGGGRGRGRGSGEGGPKPWGPPTQGRQ